MSAPHGENVQSEVRRYWKVFAALTVGTIVTVAVANVHLGIIMGIVVAVIVALIKGSLVAGYFMHLFHERKLIYFVLVLTAGGVAIMVALILASRSDQQGAQHGAFAVPQRFVDPAKAHGEHPAEHESVPGAVHHADEPVKHPVPAGAEESTHAETVVPPAEQQDVDSVDAQTPPETADDTVPGTTGDSTADK